MRLTASPALRRALPAGVAILGAYQVVQGVFMAAAPGTFFDKIGPFGPLNEHYVRDAATWSLAYGATLLVAVRRPSWRVPLLAFGLLQFGLHFINHLIDIDTAHPAWVGVFDAVALGLLGAMIGALLLAARDAEVGR
jgi:hypothetical protein